MSKALKKSQEMANIMEKKGKKFLKSGWHDYVGFAIFVFGGIYLGVKNLFAHNYKVAVVSFCVAAGVLVIVFFGKKILVKVGQMQSRL